VDRIAEAFGAEVFRAEVGEANVVSLARRLREEGRVVRILGEGSAGGVIVHPSAVRDTVDTLGALIKLLAIRGGPGGSGEPGTPDAPGLFRIWCEKSGRAGAYREDFTLADVVATLPAFTTTGAYTPDAILQVRTADHALLKDRYERVFRRDWEARAAGLRERWGIADWDAQAYVGAGTLLNPARFGEAGRGGLKIRFLDDGGRAIASVWMRGSATEPVFRVMADAGDPALERELIDWQRRMAREADEWEGD